MGWQDETQLQDMDAGDRLHLTCRACDYAWYVEVGDWVAHREYRYFYVDEITTLTHCPQFGCKSRALRIARPFPGETEAFVGGMP